jgi:ABC-2 type transport system permease protein
MFKIWVVIRREFLTRVRTKWFVVATVLGPVLMATMILLPMLMATSGGGKRSITVLDATGTRFGERVTQILNEPAVPVTATRLEVAVADLEVVAESLARVVGETELDGFLVVTLETIRDGMGEYRGANATSQIDMEVLQRVLRESVLAERLRLVGVDPMLVAQAQARSGGLRTVTIRDGEATEQSGGATFALAYVMWFLLYIAILLYGVQVLGAVVEEKTTRIVEILVSSLKPFELLAGKVIGVGAVGLFQLMIWAVAARLLLTQRERLFELAGVEPSVASAFTMPEVSVSTIAVFLVYFVLGFFLYAAVFAAVAAMSNSEAEARQAQVPVTMLYAIPAVVSLMAMMTEPDGALFIVLTMIPFSSPIAMPGRWVVSDVPITDLLASVALLILALGAVTWVAGRIFRIGILMHGKRPSPKEVLRWIRTA